MFFFRRNFIASVLINIQKYTYDFSEILSFNEGFRLYVKLAVEIFQANNITWSLDFFVVKKNLLVWNPCKMQKYANCIKLRLLGIVMSLCVSKILYHNYILLFFLYLCWKINIFLYHFQRKYIFAPYIFNLILKIRKSKPTFKEKLFFTIIIKLNPKRFCADIETLANLKPF